MILRKPRRPAAGLRVYAVPFRAEVIARVQVVDADQWEGYARRHFGQHEGDLPTTAELAAPDAHHRMWLADCIGVHR